MKLPEGVMIQHRLYIFIEPNVMVTTTVIQLLRHCCRSITAPGRLCKATGGKVVSGASLAILKVFLVLAIMLRMYIESKYQRSVVTFTSMWAKNSIPRFSGIPVCSACMFASILSRPKKRIPCV